MVHCLLARRFVLSHGYAKTMLMMTVIPLFAESSSIVSLIVVARKARGSPRQLVLVSLHLMHRAFAILQWEGQSSQELQARSLGVVEIGKQGQNITGKCSLLPRRKRSLCSRACSSLVLQITCCCCGVTDYVSDTSKHCSRSTPASASMPVMRA